MEIRSRPEFDPRRALTFMFRDRAWVRMLAAGAGLTALACLGVGVPVLLGWLGRLFRAAVEDDLPALPEFRPMSDLRAGVLPAFVVAAWALPAAVLLAIGGSVAALGGVWLVGTGLLLPAALTRLYVGLRAGDALDPVELCAYVRDNGGHYVLMLGVWALSAALGAAGLLLVLVGVFATLFWGAQAATHAMAQVYRLSRLHSPPATVASPGEAVPAAVA